MVKTEQLYECLVLRYTGDEGADYFTAGSNYEVFVDWEGDYYLVDDALDCYWLNDNEDLEDFELAFPEKSEPAMVRRIRRAKNYESGTVFIDLEVDERGEELLLALIREYEKSTEAAVLSKEIAEIEAQLAEKRYYLKELEK